MDLMKIYEQYEKRTIFETQELESKETFGITSDFDDWVSKNKLPEFQFYNHSMFDEQGVELIKDLFDGYMLAPACLYEGRPVLAYSKAVFNFEDIRIHLKRDDNIKRFILAFDWHYSRPVYRDVDPKTYIPLPAKETPTFSQAFWKIRYGEIKC